MSSARSNPTPPRSSRRFRVRRGAAFALLAYAASCAFDAASLGAQAQFFEELFGGAPDRRPSGAQRRSDDEGGTIRRRSKIGNAQDPRRRAGRQFFEIDRIGESAGRIQTLQLRWGRGVTHTIRASYAQPAIIGVNYSKSLSSAPRLICVRACDGAVVSLARYEVGDIARQHPSCETACPGAETRLYRLPANTDEMSAAVEVGSKATYAALLARIGALKDEKKSCFCGSVVMRDSVGVESFLADPTLRYGDIVATSGGLKIFRGGARSMHRASEFTAYTGSPGSPAGRLGSLAAINRMLKTPEPHGFSADIQFGPN